MATSKRRHKNNEFRDALAEEAISYRNEGYRYVRPEALLKRLYKDKPYPASLIVQVRYMLREIKAIMEEKADMRVLVTNRLFFETRKEAGFSRRPDGGEEWSRALHLGPSRPAWGLFFPQPDDEQSRIALELSQGRRGKVIKGLAMGYISRERKAIEANQLPSESDLTRALADAVPQLRIGRG